MILAFLFDVKKNYFSYTTKKPFVKEEEVLNKSYSNVCDIGKKKFIQVIFADWKDYSRGYLNNYWVFENDWKLINKKVKPNLFFDKFEYSEKANVLKKKLSKKNKIINKFAFEKFCKDKNKQYKKFPKFTPQSFLIKNNSDLKKHFLKINSKNKILKPRYGHGGFGIKIINNLTEAPKIDSDYILQEFIDTSKGIKDLKIKGVHDIRTLIINGKVLFSFVREPKSGWLANVHQGGTAKLIPTPKAILKRIKEIEKFTKTFGNRFYSIDFFFSNNKYYLVELNSKPGFDIAINFGFEKEEKELINCLFNELVLKNAKN